MPKYDKELSAFWERTIRPNWLFRVTFPQYLDFDKLNNHMVSSVRLPIINTTNEKYLKTSKLYPELFNLFDLSDGLQFEITFDENITNDVERVKWKYYNSLIHNSKVSSGVFYSPPLSSNSYIDGGRGIDVEVIDYDGKVSMRVELYKCLLVSVDGLAFDYSASDKISPTFTFKAQEIKTFL